MENIKLRNKFPKLNEAIKYTCGDEDERSRNYIFIAFYWITFSPPLARLKSQQHPLASETRHDIFLFTCEAGEK